MGDVVLAIFGILAMVAIIVVMTRGDVIRAWFNARSARLQKEQKHRQDMERLQRQKELLEAAHNVIGLLMLDDDGARSFHRRLGEAIEKYERTGVRVADPTDSSLVSSVVGHEEVMATKDERRGKARAKQE